MPMRGESAAKGASASTTVTRPKPASHGAFFGAQYLMGLQIFVRLATFSMNMLVIYIAGRKAFGVASVRFELLLSTILFLSREGMRNALLRVNVSSSSNSSPRSRLNKRPLEQEQRIINAALIPIAAGMAMAGCLYWMYASRSAQSPESLSNKSAPYYRLSLIVYIVAAWVELCVEPLFVLSRAHVLFKLQAKCEGIAVSCRCAAVVATLLLGHYFTIAEADNNPLRLLAFAAGQMAYAVAIVAAFVRYMASELDYPIWMCYMPRKIVRSDAGLENSYIGRSLGSLAATFVGQSLIKHFLTQGDSMVMAKFATTDEMGIFAFVSNYGSIPARVIFLPLEEASRAVFSKTAAAVNSQDLSKRPAADDKANARDARQVLTVLGKLQLLLGAILTVFGTLYSPILASLARQTDAAVGQALAAYCLYLPLMGLNGFLEAFVHSVASRSQLVRINTWMVGFTVVYMVLAVYVLHRLGLGSAGIIFANMLNMGLRIIYCRVFISAWFARLGIAAPQLSAMLPHPAVIGTCLGSGAVIVAISAAFSHLQNSTVFQLLMLALGGALGTAVLASIWLYEQPFIRSVRRLRSGNLGSIKTS
ncbi:Oligosaccharide translocation protein rft1 [Coemansia sp. RSA 2522]|nr:Oligosaccharide translocation protein rft1 [Coemansia sp. RSA 2522]